MPISKRFLAISFLILSFCSFGYELILLFAIVPTSSQDFVSQSLTIGVFIFGLGLGAWLGGYFALRSALTVFVLIELLLAFLGGTSPLLLESQHTIFVTMGWLQSTSWLWASQILTLVIGTLSGLELPLIHLLMRGNSAKDSKKESSWHWLVGFTYIGAFIATLLLPYFLIPYMGLVKVAFVLGALNFAVAGSFCLRMRSPVLCTAWITQLLLGVVVFYVSPVWQKELLKLSYSPFHLFSYGAQDLRNVQKILEMTNPVERIVSKYQTIDLVNSPHHPGEFLLFLNHKVQFHTRNQALYHEWMAHISIAAFPGPLRKVLVLGGGEGLLVKQLLRYPSIEEIEVVELDPLMVQIANEHPKFLNLNGGALKDPRVHVTIQDAYTFVRENRWNADAIFIDLPHPFSQELGRLYSKEFYRAALNNLTPSGFVSLDFPTNSLSSETSYSARDVLKSTLSSVGIDRLFSFGRDDAFVAFARDQRKADVTAAFKAPLLSQRAKESVRDFTDLLGTSTDPRLLNSVFRPISFQLEKESLW